MIWTRSAGSWQFWSGWGLAFVGFPLGGVAAYGLVGGVGSVGAGALGGLATGAVLGSVQWLVLRSRFPVSARWIAATSAGLGAGLALGVALAGSAIEGEALLLRAVITGTTLGFAQWAILRTAVPEALIWVPAVGAGWPLGWFITRAAGVDLRPQWSVFGTTGALAFQLLTGIVLAWLLQRRSRET